MDTLIKILTVLHHLIWILIGIILLAAIYLFLVLRPYKIIQNGLSGMEGLKTIESLLRQNIPDIGGPSASSPSSSSSSTKLPGYLSNEQLGCLEAAMGKGRLADLLKGTSIPTVEEQNKLVKCLLPVDQKELKF